MYFCIIIIVIIVYIVMESVLNVMYPTTQSHHIAYIP